MSETKYCFLLKVNVFGPLKNFGLATLLYGASAEEPLPSMFQ